MFDGNGHHTPGSETSRDAEDGDFGGYDERGSVPHPDALFGALSAGERRHLLYVLLEDPTRTFGEVADLLAGRDAGSSGPVGPAGRRRIASRLHHVHLPLLEDAGLLAYDHESGTVRLCDVSRRVADLIRFAREYDRDAGGSSP